MYTAPRFLFCNNLLNGVQRALKPGAAAAYLHKNKMKTRTTVLLTAMACITLFTLFAYCTKDTPNPQENGGGNTQTTLDLVGTTWKADIPMNPSAGAFTMYAVFTSDNAGKYRVPAYEDNPETSFTYTLNGVHGVIYSGLDGYGIGGGAMIPDNAVIVIIDQNTIGIGGRVFTRQ